MNDWQDFYSEHVEEVGVDAPRSSTVRECDLCIARVSRGLLSGMCRLVDMSGDVWFAEGVNSGVKFWKKNSDGTTQPSVRMTYAQFRNLFVW
jgi:hypothetical protein